MNDNQGHFNLYDKSPLYQLLISLAIIIFTGTVLLTIIGFAGMLIFGVDSKLLSGNFMADAGRENINFLRYLMIFQDISLFIIPAIMIMNLLKPDSRFSLNDLGKPRISEIVLIVILAFCIFPVTGFTGEINTGMNLPDWMSGIENWMKEKETETDQLIDLLTVSDTFGIMILNLVMVAVLPAISEELIFRGIIQKILSRFFRSGHPAIWITAILFSAVHLQFYGFVPRLILGLVYGYLFYWSGILWLPVMAHFVNNAVPVVVSYIQGAADLNPGTDLALWKQMIILPLPLFIGTLILVYFRKKGIRATDAVISQSEIENH